MGERLSFLVLKDPKVHAVTRMGLKVLPTEDRLVVYCTDDGPLDPRYTDQWLEWRRQRDQKTGV